MSGISAVADIAATYRSMMAFDRLGGADSFFGRLYAFEEMLKEQHEAAGEGRSKGAYGYHGMNQYGNIVCFEPSLRAMKVFVDKLGYTRENLAAIAEWYEDRTIDCATLRLYIRLFLEANDEQVRKVLEEREEGKDEVG